MLILLKPLYIFSCLYTYHFHDRSVLDLSIWNYSLLVVLISSAYNISSLLGVFSIFITLEVLLAQWLLINKLRHFALSPLLPFPLNFPSDLPGSITFIFPWYGQRILIFFLIIFISFWYSTIYMATVSFCFSSCPNCMLYLIP